VTKKKIVRTRAKWENGRMRVHGELGADLACVFRSLFAR
jgi:hypothetical protein